MTAFFKLTWQPALALLLAFVIVAWVNPGTTPGALLLFAAATLAAFVLIVVLRAIAMQIMRATSPAGRPETGADGAEKRDDDAAR
ncbi:MAG: hypothetical protein ACOCYW_06840 [Roseicyclus sp.]